MKAPTTTAPRAARDAPDIPPLRIEAAPLGVVVEEGEPDGLLEVKVERIKVVGGPAVVVGTEALELGVAEPEEGVPEGVPVELPDPLEVREAETEPERVPVLVPVLLGPGTLVDFGLSEMGNESTEA